MSLTPAQAQELDRLALAALDALRDQDRQALAAATAIHDQADARANARDAARTAQAAEQRLVDAIHALVVRPSPMPTRRPQEGAWWPPAAPARAGRWTTFLTL